MSLAVVLLAEFHILFAMLLVGYVFFFNIVVGTQLQAVMKEGLKSAEFVLSAWPSISKFLHAALGGTVLFGILLYYADYGTSMTVFKTISGDYLGAGIVFGLLVLVIGEAIQIPTAGKLAKSAVAIMQGGQTEATPEDWRALKKLKDWGIIGFVVTLLAAITMIAAAWT